MHIIVATLKFDPAEMALLPGTNAYLEYVPVPHGIELLLHVKKGTRQVSVRFNKPNDVAVPQLNAVEIFVECGDCEDVFFVFNAFGQPYEARSSFGELEGVLTGTLSENAMDSSSGEDEDIDEDMPLGVQQPHRNVAN